MLCAGFPSIGYGSLECESLRLFQKYRPDYFVDACDSDRFTEMVNLVESIYCDYFSHAIRARSESRKLAKEFDIDSIVEDFRLNLLGN